MEGTPGKTLLDKPAVAPKLPETDFFNGLVALGYSRTLVLSRTLVSNIFRQSA
jgi:hypothetical protein